VINGDIWCDWAPLQALSRTPAISKRHAHLVFVDNPPQHPDGDFCLDGERVRRAGNHNGTTLTYAGIGIFSPAFFASVPRGSVMKLRPLLDAGIDEGIITGERHAGRWVDVGTPQRLTDLDIELSQAA
jgi:MurNAc alpha-1-phosphate uridylyltransferase